MISPGQVSYSPIARHMSKSEPTIEMGGNMATASAPDRITVLPLKSSREVAYAASAASTIEMRVAIMAMPIELISAARKVSSEKMTS